MSGTDEGSSGPVMAMAVTPRARQSNYPPEFAIRMRGRLKRALGDVFGLRNFGVNLTILLPGAESALLHRHSTQDEFIYILSGTPTLVTEAGEAEMAPGMCMGFPAAGVAHQLVNRTDAEVRYLEVGDRLAGDAGSYPVDDLVASFSADGKWQFTHKDGTAY